MERRIRIMAVITLTEDNFDKEVLQAQETVLVDFWAPWCGPCRMMGPIVDEIAETRDDVKVCKVNVDDEMKLAQTYGVMNIPTLIVFKKGEIANKTVGAQSKSAIEALL
ncbi:MAG: thioredoxin [Lachnospiraceae bacterium]